MPTLRFPDQATLLRVLAGGLVPAAAYRTPASARVDEDGRIWVFTPARLSKELLLRLAHGGVEVVRSAGDSPAQVISCWQELIPLQPLAKPAGAKPVPILFSVPAPRLPMLIKRLERQSPSKWSIRWQQPLSEAAGDSRLFLNIVADPSRLAAAIEDLADVHAYTEAAPGIWITIGWSHPLTEQIQPFVGKFVLLHPPDRWEWIDDQPYDDNAVTFAPAAIAIRQTTTDVALPTIEIRWKLVAEDKPSSAELWVIRKNALAWLDQVVRQLDGVQLNRFTFAVSHSAAGTTVVLRLANKREAPPILMGLPNGFHSLSNLPNLFIPSGYRLAPLPRRDVLRRLLTDEAEQVHWVVPGTNGEFQAESIADSAFRPLSSWITYQVDEPVRALGAWNSPAWWNFADFVEVPDRARALPRRPAKPEKPATVSPKIEKTASLPETARRGLFGRALNWLTGTKNRDEQPATDEPAAIPLEDAVQTAWQLPQPRSVDPPAKLREVVEHCKVLETRFLASLGQLTTTDRQQLWPELAASYAQSNNAHEAAICWLNALWERDNLSPLWAWGWLKAEAANARWSANNVSIVDWLAAPPTPARVRAVGAYTVWAAGQEQSPRRFRECLDRIQAYLDQHEQFLPVRAAWLARSTLARLSRGDLLGLARTRDRLFERLYENGLSLDSDMPAFIRFAESGDPDRFNSVRQWLGDKRGLIHKWIQQLNPPAGDDETPRVSLAAFGLEAETSRTQDYADLMLAWGLARLGEKIQSVRIHDEAMSKLPENDVVHSFLKAAFDSRIRQMRDGTSYRGQLSPELQTRLESLSIDDRYRIDRLRQHLRILDPSERTDAFWASNFRQFQHWGQLRKQLIDLPTLDADSLQTRVRQLLARIETDNARSLPAIVLGLMECLPHLEPVLADQMLDLLPRALDQLIEQPEPYLRLLERAMLGAATIDRPKVVQALSQRFINYLEEQRTPLTAIQLEGLTGQTFRCLRRLGLKNEADRILFQIYGRLTNNEDFPRLRQRLGNDWPPLLRTLLHVAAGWYYCGRDVQGHRIIDDARVDLYQSSIPLKQRTAVAITYAATLGQIPVRLALSRFEEMFQRFKKISITGWNTHYTLQPLQLIDTVVLAVVNEDFTLGPAVRGWLDDDEYLVRQRIQRELKELMDAQGV